MSVNISLCLTHTNVRSVIQSLKVVASHPVLKPVKYVPIDVINVSNSPSQTYFLADHDQCLIGTSEIPLAGMYFDQIIPNEHLPLKFVAFSHCFRAETGAGQHSRGLYRVHQFSKVEMFVFGRPEDSQALHEELLSIQTEILNELGLHCRYVANML